MNEGFGRFCIECGSPIEQYRCANYWSYGDDMFDPPYIQICHKNLAEYVKNIVGYYPWEQQ